MDPGRPPKPWAWALVPLAGLLTLAFTGTACSLFAEHRLAAGSDAWSPVPATVIERGYGEDAEGGWETVRYRYEVAGRSYESTRGAFPDDDVDARHRTRVPPPSAESAAITAYVSASDPAEATLARGATRLGSVPWTLTVMALLAAWGMVACVRMAVGRPAKAKKEHRTR